VRSALGSKPGSKKSSRNQSKASLRTRSPPHSQVQSPVQSPLGSPPLSPPSRQGSLNSSPQDPQSQPQSPPSASRKSSFSLSRLTPSRRSSKGQISKQPSVFFTPSNRHSQHFAPGELTTLPEDLELPAEILANMPVYVEDEEELDYNDYEFFKVRCISLQGQCCH